MVAILIVRWPIRIYGEQDLNIKLKVNKTVLTF